MENTEIARLAYLVLLGSAVIGWFLTQNRANLGKAAQQAMIWVFIILGLVAGYGLWGDISRDLAPRQSVLATGQVEIPRMFDGHFYLTAELNGTPIEFVVDTGATEVVLTMEDAERAGIDTGALAFTGSAMTANGMVRTAPATIDEVKLGAITDERLRVYVNGGEMDDSLLGMSYLRRFEKIEIEADMLILTR